MSECAYCREAAAGDATFAYSDGTPMRLGDLCVRTGGSGVWEIVHLHTFDNGRSWASLANRSGKRTAADLHEIRLVQAATSKEDQLLDARVDRIHGPGASKVLTDALLDGSVFGEGE